MKFKLSLSHKQKKEVIHEELPGQLIEPEARLAWSARFTKFGFGGMDFALLLGL
jgi:hypothetical protein